MRGVSVEGAQVAPFLRAWSLWLRWGACLPTLPLLSLQAKAVRKRVPRLPDAAGLRSGIAPGRPGAGTLRVAIIGESTAVGVGVATLDEALPGHFARALVERTGMTVSWTVIGGNGLTAKRVLSRLEQTEREPFDIALLLLGVNDVFRLTPIRAWRAHVRALVECVARRGCPRVVFSAVPPIGHFPALPRLLRASLGVRAALLDHHLQRLARELPGAAYCAVSIPLEAAYVAEDGVHSSSAGYRVWAQCLAASLGAEPPKPASEPREAAPSAP